MLNENAKKWVAALRSGKYKQGRLTLHRTSLNGDEFCCLGVACALAVENGVNVEVGKDGYNRFVYGGATIHLPPSVRDWLGLADVDGRWGDHSSHRSLMCT